ncbi:MAG: sensor histidine kinase [Lachnospiraceae bacterium]|nr:sensor histidine kinase [Lachnospiraceae bacterium]
MERKKRIPDLFIYSLAIGIAGQLYISPNTSMNFYLTLGVSLLGFFMVTNHKNPPMLLALCGGIFTTAFRVLPVYDLSSKDTLQIAYSTMIYYLVYGSLCSILFQEIGEYKKEIKILVVGIIDFFSNCVEVMILNGIDSISVRVLLLCAVIRTGTIWVLVVSYERSRMLIIQNEHEKRYERLNDFIINIYAEVFYLKKSQKDLEEAMKLSHKIYNESKNQDALDVAIQIHEIKKDYYRLLGGLSHMIHQVDDSEIMDMRQIFSIMQKSMEHQTESLGKDILVVFRQKTEGSMIQYYDIFVILNNLIINAIDASKNGDEILVTYDKIDKSHFFSVKDYGVGMSEGIKECIFDPGFSTKFDPHTGDISSGIGLCHVKEIVEKRGGSIDVESEEGKGSKFLIWIPMKEGER